MMDETTVQLRNFKDFLQLYNTITEGCFTTCVDNFNSRGLEYNEALCADSCASKFVKFNHRLMAIYVNVQNILMTKRIEAAEKEQKASETTSVVEEQKEIIPIASDTAFSESSTSSVS